MDHSIRMGAQYSVNGHVTLKNLSTTTKDQKILGFSNFLGKRAFFLPFLEGRY
jgi:hypothetical protein